MEKTNNNKIKSKRPISITEPILLRSLNLIFLTLIGVGTAIGSSIFVIPGHAIESAGPAIILTYLFGAFSALTDSTSYAELASSISNAGGGYTFVGRAFKGIPVFLSGWYSWMGNIVDCSVGAIVFALSIWYYVKWIEPFSLAIITLIIFAFINYQGVKSLSLSATILTSILILGVLFFIGNALINADFNRLSPFFPNGILPSILMVSYIFPTFAGYQIIATMSEETKIAGKNIPRAIFLTLILSTILFTSFTISILFAAPLDIYAGSLTPIQDAANYFMGPLGALLIGICSITASLTSVNGTMAAATRISYSMSRDGLLPPFLEKVHLKNKIPYRTLFLSVILSILFLLTRSIELIVYMVSLGYIVTSVLVGLSVIQLRRKEPLLFRPFKVPFYPYTTIIAITTTAIMIPMLSVEALFLGSVFGIIGIITLTLTKRINKK